MTIRDNWELITIFSLAIIVGIALIWGANQFATPIPESILLSAMLSIGIVTVVYSSGFLIFTFVEIIHYRRTGRIV